MGGAATTLRQASALDPLDISTSIIIGPQVRNAAKFISHSLETREAFLRWVCELSWLEDFLRSARKNEFKHPSLFDEKQLHYLMPSGIELLVDEKRSKSPTHHQSYQKPITTNKTSTDSNSSSEYTTRAHTLDLGTPMEALSPKNVLPLMIAVLMPMYFQTKDFRHLVNTTLAPHGHVKVHILPIPVSTPSCTPISQSMSSSDKSQDTSSLFLTQQTTASFSSASSSPSLRSNTNTNKSSNNGVIGIKSSVPVPGNIQIPPVISTNLDLDNNDTTAPESDGIARLRLLLLSAVDVLKENPSRWSEKLRHPHHTKWLSSLLLFVEELPLCISLAAASPQTPHFPLLYVNQAFESTTLYARHYAIGRNCRFLQHPQRTEPHQVQHLVSALRQKQSVRLALTNMRRDGSFFLNFLAMQPIVAEHQEYVLGIQHDLSGREHRLSQDLLVVDALMHLLPPLLR